ncbi:hypothetical protein M5D96_008551 [Drosophila gunungcola]|uniref:Uncharacterized protein n=1 Tax=Drosophila gunungcola TaxID=103775 RepID=A0A9P9YKH1_9MUSC|nr:hypothetical protein M5D96_008551 [Drosophila gunungcola]
MEDVGVAEVLDEVGVVGEVDEVGEVGEVGDVGDVGDVGEVGEVGLVGDDPAAWAAAIKATSPKANKTGDRIFSSVFHLMEYYCHMSRNKEGFF